MKIRPAVRPRAETLGVRDVQRLAVTAYFDARRKPAGGNVSQDLAVLRIEHCDGVDSGAGDVQSLLVRAERESERQHAAQTSDRRRGLEHNRLLHLVRACVEDSDAVLARVRNEDSLASCD